MEKRASFHNYNTNSDTAASYRTSDTQVEQEVLAELRSSCQSIQPNNVCNRGERRQPPRHLAITQYGPIPVPKLLFWNEDILQLL